MRATQAMVRYLRLDVGLSESDLTYVTGATERTVRRWLSADVKRAHRPHLERLNDLCAVVALLEQHIATSGIGNWLWSPNPAIRARPIELLARGDLYAVLQAAEAIGSDPSRRWAVRD